MKRLLFIFFLLLSTNANAQINRISEIFIGHKPYELFDLYLINVKGTTTPSAGISNGATSFTATSITGAVVGEAVNISENKHVFQSIVTNITSNTITVSSPIDRAFTTSAVVQFGAWNMSVNGSVTPVTFQFPAPSNSTYHIITINGVMSDTSPMDDSLFGSLTALTNPIYMYLDNNNDNKYFLVSNNSGFFEWGATTDYPTKVPSGTYSFRFTKNLLDTNEGGIFVYGGEYLKVVIRSDLTGIDKFTMTIHGHVAD